MSNYSALANVLLNVPLYTAVAALSGTGGASVIGWENPDQAGYFPRHAQLLFTNNGAADLVIGDGTDGSAVLLCNSIVAGPLFEERQVTIGPGESVWCNAPVDAAALGRPWAIRAPLASAAAISVSVVARPITVLGAEVDAPTAIEIAAAVAAPSAAAISAAVAAPSAATIATAVDSTLSSAHGAGVWANGTAPTAAAIASAVWTSVIEGSFTAEHLMRLISSALFGDASGLEGASPTFRNLANTANRIVASYVSGTRIVTTRSGT